MRSISSYPVTGFQFRRGLAGLPGLIASLLLLIAVSLSPAHALEIPSDEEQDVLIRSTLMTFNDANMTGNYTVRWPRHRNSSSRNIPPSRHLPPSRRSGRTNCFSRRWSPPNTIPGRRQNSIRTALWCWPGCSRPTNSKSSTGCASCKATRSGRSSASRWMPLACSDRRFAQLPNYRSDDCSSRAAWVSSSAAMSPFSASAVSASRAFTTSWTWAASFGARAISA